MHTSWINRYSCIYKAHMNPTLNGGSKGQCFEHSETFKIRNGNSYTELPHVYSTANCTWCIEFKIFTFKPFFDETSDIWTAECPVNFQVMKPPCCSNKGQTDREDGQQRMTFNVTITVIHGHVVWPDPYKYFITNEYCRYFSMHKQSTNHISLSVDVM